MLRTLNPMIAKTSSLCKPILFILSYTVGAEAMQEHSHSLSASLFISKARAGDIAVFIQLFQQGALYAQVIFHHISHFQIPLFSGERAFARSVPLLHLDTEPLSKPFYRRATGLVVGESTVFIDVAHNIGFFH